VIANKFFCNPFAGDRNCGKLAGVMKTNTPPKTWFITGTSSGFGRTLTEKLLARGDRVAATLRLVLPYSPRPV
jgi:hypothetical protein